MNFGKFETREQVVRRLEQPVRDYWADTGPFEHRVGQAKEMGAILAELDRLDLVAKAQLAVSREKTARALYADAIVRATVRAATGDCSKKVRDAGWSYGEKRCKNPAKHSLPNGKPECGVHFKSDVGYAIRVAQGEIERAYGESGVVSEAEKIVFADRDLRNTRENWVK
jgi:hypothetical protein